MSAESHFESALFAFLRDLAANNRREWFQQHRERYEEVVREPAQQFISDFGPELRRISPHFRADPRPVGGSLFRIHRDVRFSRDKSPYKTHTGIQFRHQAGKDAHAPGFYLHLEPGNVFAGVGCWHPAGESLRRIRETIAGQSANWRRAIGGKRFRETFTLGGESLKRSPQGFDPDHPLIEDLKRKDFIGFTAIDEEAVIRSDFFDRYVAICRAGAPLVRFLCEAVGVDF